MAFVHLHVHSEYSLLDGACRVRDLSRRAAELGQSSIAITDHGVMYGAVVFYKEAVKAGVKPIIGCEVYVAARTRFDKDFEHDANRHHLVLLCKDDAGYRNLCQIVSASFTEGFYTKPRVDMDLLRKFNGGLIALSACVSGEVPKLIIDDRYNEAKAKALELQELFGDGNFYLELQNHGFTDQPKANAGLLSLHRETGIPLVLTNDVHYMTRSDAGAQEILMCVQTGKTMNDTDRMRFESEELYLKSEDEMLSAFPDRKLISNAELTEAIANTCRIADMCNFAFDFTQHHLPEFNLPDGEKNAEEYLKKLCLTGLDKLYGGNATAATGSTCAATREQLLERLNFELGIISQMGFTDYFLIMSDCIYYCKRVGIPIGPGRGSAAGSLVSYCLGLTNVDPIKYGLYFERFLNPERVTMPDIDIDFCERRRGEAIDYVKEKYGADRVAQIVTFGTLKAKNAVRSISKALALTFQEENELAREIPDRMPDGSAVTVEKALSLGGRLKAMYDEDPRVKRVLDTAKALEDMPKDYGTHASGVVVTKLPVREYLPLTLSKKDNTIVTQYTMVPLEELGLLKMDFLGLRNLTVIDDAVREIRKTQPDFSIDNIPDDDAATYEMLSAGKTSGVFQLESQGMTGVCTGLGPKSIEDITAVIALYRPGPMDSIPKFLEWSRNPELIRYKHPLLEPILSVTYGCILYQEQVMEIFRVLAGFTVGQADMIRRAMSKKKAAEIEREKVTFIDGDPERGITGAVGNGVPRDVASSIYDEIEAFANYAFNKSHAVGYAIISYQTAYLKCHYPHIYMAALMSSVLGNNAKISEYTAACRKMGINLLPPSINESGAMFSVSGNDLRYGLVAVKNIGEGLIERVVSERKSTGRFKSFEDFCKRINSTSSEHGGDVNRRALESMIKCGCFDGLGANRRQLMDICQMVLDDVAQYKRRNIEGQMDLFGMAGGFSSTDTAGSCGSEPAMTDNFGIELPDLPEFSKGEMTRMEREVTGLYLSGHPMDDYREIAERCGAVNIGEILADAANDDGVGVHTTTIRKYKNEQKITVAGVIETVRTKPTRNNTLMAYISLDDGSGTIELLAFQRVIDESDPIIKAEELVLIQGKLSERDEKEPQIVVDKIELLKDAKPLSAAVDGSKGSAGAGRSDAGGTTDGKTLYVQMEREGSPEYEHLKLVHSMFPGREKMVVYFKDTKKKLGATCIIHDAFVTELKEKFGEKNIVVK